ncbi:MAG: zf-HC2 domain-containing protein [Candidatus Eremiobacteraeota bacterium]|nr:zf-HC2 domain-containing protein [Candidatus Eremiobacteraeota bacterium]
MNCKAFRSMMLDYETGDLPEKTRQQWENHLIVCADCNREWNEWLKTARLLEKHEDIEPGADFMPRLYLKLAREEKRPHVRSSVIPWFMAFPKLGMAIAGLVLIFAITFVVWHGFSSKTPEPAGIFNEITLSKSNVPEFKYLAYTEEILFPKELPSYSIEESSEDNIFPYEKFGNPRIDSLGSYDDLAQLILEKNRR